MSDDVRKTIDDLKAEQAAYWTPERVEEAVAAISAPFDAMVRGPGFEEAFNEAAGKLPPDKRMLLWTQMGVLSMQVEKLRSLLMDGETSLLGSAADQGQVMNLLCAVDPEKLSVDVIDRLMGEIGRAQHLGSWTALPHPLFEMMVERMQDQEQAFVQQEREAEAQADADAAVRSGRRPH